MNKILATILVFSILFFPKTSSADVVGPHLVGWWAMYDGKGQKVTDYGTGKNNGTTQNSPVWTTGLQDNALVFNGSNQFVLMSDAALPSGNSARTTAFWAKTNYTGGPDLYLFSYGTQSNNQAWELGIYSGGKFVFTQVGSSCQSNVVSADGKWHLFAFTWTGTVGTFYIDGKTVSQTTCSFTLATTLNQGYIGKDLTTKYIAATIADVRMYDVALTAQDIWTLYISTSAAVGRNSFF